MFEFRDATPEEQQKFLKEKGLVEGARVLHKNRGKYGGSGRVISSCKGTITGTGYEGFSQSSFNTGHIYTVMVLWDDGEEYSMLWRLAEVLSS